MDEPCRPSCPAGDCANCVRFDLQAERLICTRCGRDGHRASNCPLPIPAMNSTTKADHLPRHQSTARRKIALDLMARAVGCTARELVKGCLAVGMHVDADRALAVLVFQAKTGRAFVRWRHLGEGPKPALAVCVYFATEAQAVASGLPATRDELIARNGGTYAQRLFAAQQAGREGRAKAREEVRQARQKTPSAKPKRPELQPPAAHGIDAPVRLSDSKRSIAKAAHIDDSRARRISVPAPRGRYEAEPGAFGAGFAAAGPGRDINTGRAWE